MRISDWSSDVCSSVLLHQPDERHLRRAVIGLPEIAVKARRGGRHHDTAEAALAHPVPHRFRTHRGAHQMDVDDEAEVGEVPLREAFVAKNAGIVDQNIEIGREACRERGWKYV